jgi:homeobox-leucine zipper protein
MFVYSPIILKDFNMVMNGEDSSFVPLFPSSFSILPDDHSSNKTIVETSSDGSSSSGSGGNSGCLLTFGFQILLCGLGTSKLTSKSVDTVNEHIARIIQNIKDALEVA